MVPLPSPRVLGVLFLALALPPHVQAASTEADIASIPATVTIGSVGLPGKKQGAKDLSLALGKDVEAAIRDEVKVALVALRAFTQVVPEGGQFVLDLEISAVRREDPDPAAPEDRRPVSMTLDGHWTWRDASGVLRSGDSTVTSERIVDGPPQRADLAIVARKALDELAERAFADLYAAKR
jgi:hypothetical protein